ncbi:MAG TPA: hypothetical protein VED59_05925 [Acidimicrobiales bacterium]|nr:hypothetical protein [Acidimicrobiales bacterium]
MTDGGRRADGTVSVPTTSTPRRHCVTDDPSSLVCHDHVGWFGDGQADLDAVATAFSGPVFS